MANEELTAFFKKLEKAPSGILFLDYDGTLAPFHKDRTQAYPYAGILPRLEAIAEDPRTKLIVISGRSLEELCSFLPLSSRIELWGCHGGERLDGQGRYHACEPSREQKTGLAQCLTLCRKWLPSTQYEVKLTGIAVHWRDQPREAIDCHILPGWKEIIETCNLEQFPFNGGMEIRLLGISKAVAVNTVLDQSDPNAAVAYLGDDYTDEEAFKALGDRGLSILVKEAPRTTEADLFLTPPEGIIRFLDQWLMIMRRTYVN